MEKKIVYHVDRTGVFKNNGIGDTIEVCSVTNNYYSSLIFGSKISNHGERYINTLGVTVEDDRDRCDVYWELYLEIVRANSFPHHKSRYHAMFGFNNTQDIIQFTNQWLKEFYISPLYVYELEVHDYLDCDMNLLEANTHSVEGMPNTYLDNVMMKHAYEYWSGEISSTPVIETLIYDTATIKNIYDFSMLKFKNL